MQQIPIQGGLADVCVQIFIADTRLQNGGGLTGLEYDDAGLVVYYRKRGGSVAAIALAATTAGSHVDGGFVELDATNLPGWYELQIPDACVAAGFGQCSIQVRGAANMAGVNLDLVEAASSSDLVTVRKILTNKRRIDATADNVETVFDDDGVSTFATISHSETTPGVVDEEIVIA